MHRVGRVISNCQTFTGCFQKKSFEATKTLCRHLSAQPQSSRKPDYNQNEDDYFISYDKINPNIKVMEYIVRGPIVIRAAEIEKELAQVNFRFITFIKFTIRNLLQICK